MDGKAAVLEAEIKKQAGGHRAWARQALVGFGDTVRRGDFVRVSVSVEGKKSRREYNGLPVQIEAFGKHRKRDGGRVWVVGWVPAYGQAVSFHMNGAGWSRSFELVGSGEPTVKLVRRG